MSRANEAHELAVDTQHIGSIALLSEHRAAEVIGLSTELNVPNPLEAFKKRRTLRSLYGTGRVKHQQTDSFISSAKSSL